MISTVTLCLVAILSIVATELESKLYSDIANRKINIEEIFTE